jgi:hypothetical protein
VSAGGGDAAHSGRSDAQSLARLQCLIAPLRGARAIPIYFLRLPATRGATCQLGCSVSF